MLRDRIQRQSQGGGRRMNPYPNWVCHDCGIKHGRRVLEIATYHHGTCGLCVERGTSDRTEGAIYDIVGHCKVAGNKWEGKTSE